MLESWAEFFTAAKEQYAAAKSGLGPLRLTKGDIVMLALRKGLHDLHLFVSDVKQDLGDISLVRRTLILGLVVTVAALAFDRITAHSRSLARQSGLPVLQWPKGVSRWDYQAGLREGARKYPNTPYIISYSGYEYVVYPGASFDEVKRLPAATASMIEWFTSVYFQGWRFLGHDNSSLHKMLAVDLTRAVPSKTHERQIQAWKAIDEVLDADSRNWKAVPLSSSLMDIVARTNATSLVGPDLGNDPRWCNAVKRLPIAIMLPVFICHAVPRVIRPLISAVAFAPAWALYWYMGMVLRPVVTKNMEQNVTLDDPIDLDKSKNPGIVSNGPQSSFPLTAWLMSRYNTSERNLEQVIHDYIVTSFESTPSTAGTLYFILAELVARPALVEELRDELKASTDRHGYLPQNHVSGLPKLDSVMRESSRVNAFSYLTLFRKVLGPTQLSVGPSLPAGSLICVDANHLTTDPSRWSNAETFEPMRFFRMRQEPGQENLHQFTSLGSDVPVWGDGLQACPGRVFAASTIKIILAHLLLSYDLQLPEGAQKPKRNSMPNGSMSPDMGCKIFIRKRQV
ncbi:cytochrome P450 oxidoreductase [Seiridium cupressi]